MMGVAPALRRLALAATAALATLALAIAALPSVPARAGDAPAAAIRGRVVTGSARPPKAGKSLTLLCEGAPPRTTTTDPWGRFEFADLRPGAPYALLAEEEGCARDHLTGLVLLAGEVRDVGPLLLAPPARFTVHVRDAAGRPVEGAVVEAFRKEGGPLQEFTSRLAPERPAVPASSLRTGADGRALFDVPGNTEFTFAATAPGRARVAKGRNALFTRREGDVVLVLPAPAPLAGRVLDGDGRPVPGAVVAARIAPRVWDWRHGEREEGPGLWQRTEADAEGRYSFESLAPGEVEVLAGRAEGLLCGVGTVDTRGIAEFDVTLPGTATVRGRFTDAATGAAVPGAVVAWRQARGLVARMAVADGEGAYVLEAVEPGEYPVPEIVMPDGWTRRAQSRAAGDSRSIAAGDVYTLDWVGRRAASVEGRVAHEGRPVSGAAIHVYRSSQDGTDWPWNTEGVTDADGHYRIDNLEPGTVAALATFPGDFRYELTDAFRSELRRDAAVREREAFTAESGKVAVRYLEPVGTPRRPGETAESAEAAVQIEIERNADQVFGTDHVRVLAQVRTADGVALDRALGRVEHGEVRGQEFWGLDKGWPVDADGTFRQDDRWWRADDRIFVLAWDANHDVAVVEVPRGKPGEREAEVEVVLPPTPVLAARVVCGGEPVARATVHRGGTLVARSGPDGRFDLRLRRGTVDLAVAADGFVRELFEDLDVPHEGVVDLELARATTIEGVVVSEAGEPLAGVRVTPLDDLREVPRAYRGGRVPVTDAAGRFRFDELPPGEFRLTVSATASSARIATRSSEPVAAGTRDVRIVALPGRSIAGRIVGPDGKGVARVDVECAAEEWPAKFEDDGSAETDAEGRFRFDGLLEGPYRLDVVPRVSDELVPTRLRLAAGKADLEVALAAAGVLAGTVVDADGAPLRRAGVEVRRLDAWETDAPKWPGRLDDWTDDEGRFRILVPSDGRYALEFGSGRVAEQFFLQGAEDVRPGAADLRLTAFRGETLRGVARDPDGTPVWNAEVTLRPASGGSRRFTTRGDGAFHFPGLAPGLADVEVRAPGRVPRLLREVKIGTTNLEVVLPKGRWIAGKLLDAAGEPAKGWTVRALRVSDPETDLWRTPVTASGGFEIYGLDEDEWRLDAVRVEVVGGAEKVVESRPLGTFRTGARGLELRLPE